MEKQELMVLQEQKDLQDDQEIQDQSECQEVTELQESLDHKVQLADEEPQEMLVATVPLVTQEAKVNRETVDSLESQELLVLLEDQEDQEPRVEWELQE